MPQSGRSGLFVLEPHSLKGSAGNGGAAVMSDAASNLEQASARGDFAEVAQLMLEMESQAARLIEELKNRGSPKF